MPITGLIRSPDADGVDFARFNACLSLAETDHALAVTGRPSSVPSWRRLPRPLPASRQRFRSSVTAAGCLPACREGPTGRCRMRSRGATGRMNEPDGGWSRRAETDVGRRPATFGFAPLPGRANRSLRPNPVSWSQRQVSWSSWGACATSRRAIAAPGQGEVQRDPAVHPVRVCLFRQ